MSLDVFGASRRAVVRQIRSVEGLHMSSELLLVRTHTRIEAAASFLAKL